MPLSWSVVVPVPCVRLVDVRVICPRAGRVVPKWSPTALFVPNPDPPSGGAWWPTVCASRGAIPCRSVGWHAGCRGGLSMPGNHR
jgi:hypothetical protein